MRQLIIAFTLIASVYTTKSFAAEKNISPIVMETFHHSFKDAKNVTWEETNGLIRVNFMSEGKESYAYYTNEGELMVVAKQVSITELPNGLQTDLKNKYSDYTVINVYSLESDDHNEFCVVLSKDNKTLTLQGSYKKWRTVLSEKK